MTWKKSSSTGDSGHSHTNLSTLEKIGELNGTLLFNGQPSVTTNQWGGKIWSVIGDSISNPLAYPDRTLYHKYVKDMLGIATLDIHASSGATLAKASNNSLTVMMDSASASANLVTSFGGINDYLANSTVGTIGDTGVVTTIYGGLHYICQRMINYHPNAKYALFTPLKAQRSVNTSGFTVTDVADIIIEVGAYYSIPVLDLHRKSLIDPNVTIHKDTFNPDKVHPNSAGHERISNLIAEFLKTL